MKSSLKFDNTVKKALFLNVLILLVIISIIQLVAMIGSLAWWSFVFPVIILGIIVALLKWKISFFAVGFSSGFIVWFGGNFYFDIIYNGIILNKMAMLLSSSKIVVLIIAGLIGGALTGLSMYIGKNLVSPPGISELEQ